jgi:hypothetical protein
VLIAPRDDRGMFGDPLTDTIAGFLNEIGIDVTQGELGDDCFLPGIEVVDGGLRVDPRRLRHPGDVLHEAGHLAVLPADGRETFEDPAVGIERLEVRAIAWSYAAALHLGLDPAVVFHEGGYRGKSNALLLGFACGVYPGAADLVELGMTDTGMYPRMRTWVRG